MSPKSFRGFAATTLAAAALLLASCGVDTNESSLSASGSGKSAESGGVTVPDAPDAPDEKAGTPANPENFEGTGGAVFLNRAAEATSEVKTQRVDMRMEMADGFMPFTMSMDGQIDLENDRLQMDIVPEFGDLDLGLDEGDMEGFEDFDMGSLLGDMSMTIVQDGDTVYMKSAMFSMFADSDKPWISMPADELDTADAGQKPQNPNDFLGFLRATDAEVTEVGQEDVRGVSTTHYETVLDLREIMEQAAPEERADMEEALGAFDEMGTGASKLPTEVWIDGEGMVRRMTMTMDLSGMADTEDDMSFDLGSMVISIELFDFNEPVEIEVPDASQVGDFDPSMFDMDLPED